MEANEAVPEFSVSVNLRTWQKYLETLSASNQITAELYFIGAVCSELTQEQFTLCMETVQGLIKEEVHGRFRR